MKNKKLIYYGLLAVILMIGSLFILGQLSVHNSKGPEISLEYEGTQVVVKANGRRDLLSDKASRVSRLKNNRMNFKPLRLKPTQLAQSKKDKNKKKDKKKDKKAKEAKKKKAKKKKNKKAEADKLEGDEEVELDEPKVEEDLGNNQNPMQPSIAGPISPAVATTDDEKVVNEWLENLISNPTKTNLIAFVKEHEAGEISDEAFYAIIEALLENTSAPVAHLALEVLEITPTVRSFTLLADYTVKDGVSPQLYQKAQKAIARFSFSGSYKMLKEVLVSSESTTAVVYASQNLRVLVERLVTQSIKDTDQRISTLNVKKNEFKELVELIPVLRGIIDEANNEQITTALNQAIQTIQNSISQVPFTVEVTQASSNDLADAGF